MGLEDLEAHVKSEPYVGSTNNLQAGTISSKANEALQEFTEGAFQNIADMERLTSDLMVFLPSLNACLLDPICDAIHDLEQFMVAASDPSFARALISPIGREFKTRINMMRQDIGLLRAHAELYKTRFETHKSTLHIMFAHHDNSINMKIALESKKNADANLKLAKQSAVIANATKRDSSSMKSIALLTMVFLPGTFMAVSQYTLPIYNYH